MVSFTWMCDADFPFSSQHPSQPFSDAVMMLRWNRRHAVDVVIPACMNEEAAGGKAGSGGWLVGATPAPPILPYRRRPLLFFAGHIPKLYISSVRYSLWAALRRAQLRGGQPAISLISSHLDCQIGAFEICQSEAAIEANYSTFCWPRCDAEARNNRRIPGSN
jgi:hypothetical protein